MAVKWDPKSEKLVNGYIHEMERKIVAEDFFIPDGIIKLCLLYFFQFFDEWDTENASVNALIAGKFVSNKNKDRTLARFSTFGVHQFNKGIHEWKFKIHELNEDTEHWLYFGIATSTKYVEGWFGDHPLDHTDNYYSYAFGVSTWAMNLGVICNPSVRSDISNFHWEKGDDVCMTLDLTAKTLKYERNGSEILVIDNVYNDFDDKPDVKYRMANNIDIATEGFVKVELVSYQCLSLCE